MLLQVGLNPGSSAGTHQGEPKQDLDSQIRAAANAPAPGTGQSQQVPSVTTGTTGTTTSTGDAYIPSSNTVYNSHIDKFKLALFGVDDIGDTVDPSFKGLSPDEIKEFKDDVKADSSNLNETERNEIISTIDDIANAANEIKEIFELCIKVRMAKGEPVASDIKTLLESIPKSQQHRVNKLEGLSRRLRCGSNEINNAMITLYNQSLAKANSKSFINKSCDFLQDHPIGSSLIFNGMRAYSLRPDSMSISTGVKSGFSRLHQSLSTNAKVGTVYTSAGKWVNAAKAAPKMQPVVSAWNSFTGKIPGFLKLGSKAKGVPILAVVGTTLELGTEIYSWSDYNTQAAAEKNKSLQKKLYAKAASARNDAILTGLGVAAAVGAACFLGAPLLPALFVGGLVVGGIKLIKNSFF